MFKRYILIVLFLFIAQMVAAKPVGPVKGSISPEVVKVSVGKVVAFALTLETDIAFSELEVNLKLSNGVELVNGKSVTSLLDIKPHDKKILNYKVRVKEKGEQKVIVTARAKNLGPHENYGKTFITVINPLPEKKPVIQTDSDGVRSNVTTVPTVKSK